MIRDEPRCKLELKYFRHPPNSKLYSSLRLDMMGDEKLKIAVLGPLGTYTHEASVYYERLTYPNRSLGFSRQL